MSRSKSESLLGLTESFFHNYLQQPRGASGHTVRAYRDALKVFYSFLADQKRKPVADLALDDIQSDALPAFLDHVESRRGNSAPELPLVSSVAFSRFATRKHYDGPPFYGPRTAGLATRWTRRETPGCAARVAVAYSPQHAGNPSHSSRTGNQTPVVSPSREQGGLPDRFSTIRRPAKAVTVLRNPARYQSGRILRLRVAATAH